MKRKITTYETNLSRNLEGVETITWSQKLSSGYTSNNTVTGKEFDFVQILSRSLEESIIIPENALQDIEQLANKLQLYKKTATGVIKLAYIVSLVTNHTNKFENNGCPIHAKRISKILGIKHQEFKKIMELLCDEENGILKVRCGYNCGVNSTKYSLREKFCGSKILVMQFRESSFTKKLNNKGARFYNNDYNTTFYLSFFKKLTISIPKESPDHFLMVGDFTSSNTIKTNYFNAIGVEFPQFCLTQMINGNFRASRPDKLSRVHTNLTNLPKEFRYYLRCEGKPLWEIDIRNSQPLLASIIFENLARDRGIKDLPSDINLYKQDCEKGEFYEYFMKLNEIDTKDAARGEFKKKFFSEVFFSSVKLRETALCKQFKARYPTCYDMICFIKGGVKNPDYNQFAIKLQQTEANIIFDEINIQLLEMGIPAYNIFDSILHLPEHNEIVMDMVKNSFNKRGLNPSISTNHYDKYEHQYGVNKCA